MRQRIQNLSKFISRKSRNFKLIIALFIFGIIIISFYKVRIAPQRQKKIETYKVKRGAIKEELTISGSIDAEEHIVLRFQTGGKLVWVGVKEGDYVKKWTGIASLDRRELQKKLDRSLKDYMTTRWDFDQIKDDNKVIVNDKIKRIVDKAQFTLDRSVIDVEIANLFLEEAGITTPIEGLVVRVSSPYAGVNVSPNQAEFEIVNPNTIYFKASADQTEVTKLQNGEEGELVLDSFEDERISGTINNISFIPQTGETGTVYPLKFSINRENSNYKYKIGMTGDLSFVTDERKNVLYLPVKFVKTENGKRYVNLKQDEKLVKKQVKIGLETDEYIEIKSGVTQGDIVYD